MSFKNFVRENLVLVTGITLPILLMFFFMLSTLIPQTLSDPPQYDLVFYTDDYSGRSSVPVNVNFTVKDGTLTAQYTANKKDVYHYSWRKLYLFDAKTQTTRELPFPIPDVNNRDRWNETVEATKDLKLDTTLQAPDGYELSYEGYSRSGLINDLFWGGSGSREVRLRKGASSLRLGNHETFYYYSVHFIGWVKK